MNYSRKYPHVYILLVLAMIFYGFSFIATKIALKSFDPISIITFRLIISSICLGIFFKNKIRKIQRRTYFFLILASFFQPFIYFLSENYGLSLIDASIGSIIIGMIPVFTPIFAFIFLKEKLNWGNGLGILFAFAGVSVIMIPDGVKGDINFLGIFLMFLAVFAAVGYTIVVFKIPARYSSVDIVFYQNLFGLILFLPLFLLIDLPKFDAAEFSQHSLISVLILGLFPSTLSFIFLSKSIRSIGANKTNIFTNLVPVFSVFFAYFFLDELLNTAKIIGMGMVILGVITSQLGNTPPPKK